MMSSSWGWLDWLLLRELLTPPPVQGLLTAVATVRCVPFPSRVSAESESHIIELTGFAITPPVLSVSQHAALLVFLDGLNLKIFEDMDPASAAEVGWRTCQGILLELEVTQGHHEPQLDRQ